MGPDYDLSLARLDPGVDLAVHREALATVQGWFREAGLSADEARLLVERFNAAVDPYTRPATAGDRLAREAEDYLRALWKGDYARSMAATEAAIARLGGAPLEDFLRESGLRHDPFVLRTLAAAAARNGWHGNETETIALPAPAAGMAPAAAAEEAAS